MIGGALCLVATDYTHTLIEAAKVHYVQAEEVVEHPPKEIQLEVKINWTRERMEEEVRKTFPENPNTMVAVTECESNFNPLAVGPTSDYGLLQIHAPTWEATAKELGYYNYRTDIEENLKMARHIYDVQGIRAWVCYSKGYYTKYL